MQDNCKEPQKYKRKSTSTNKGGAREQRIVNVLKKPACKLYILFLHAMLPFFNSFNTLLQSEVPRIHQLHVLMMKPYMVLLGCLVLLSVLQIVNDRLSINFFDKEQQRADKNLFVGCRITKWMEEEELECTPGARRFLLEARSFFINSLEYMQEKFPLDVPLMKAGGTINPA